MRGQRTIRRRAASTRTLFQMPSGRVLVAGPEPSDSWFFRVSNIGALSWEDAPDPVRHTLGCGVLLPGTPSGSTRVALIGGVDRDCAAGHGHLHPASDRADLRRGEPDRGLDDRAFAQLRASAPQHGAAARPLDGHGGRRLRDPERQPARGRPRDPPQHRDLRPGPGQWTLGPAQDELRTYHSTALLLPDGRVLSAGDDGYGGNANDTAEIYEPPYLFRGPRPTIQSAPEPIEYGETFTVETSADATKAVLMAPAAVTHANDMNQRNVPLAATVQTARAPDRDGTGDARARSPRPTTCCSC